MLLVPEDRKTQGLLLTNTVERNLSLGALPQLGRGGLLDRKEERALAARQMTALGVRAAGLDQQVGLLSGGNQQKVVLGKWLALNPTVLILDEPTRGVDVGAKSEIYKLMFDLAERGVGILMISSEMEEVISVSDRVIVIHEGAIRGELQGEHMTEENILSIAIGQRETI
jgi:ribose transport system ATP-binding protein